MFNFYANDIRTKIIANDILLLRIFSKLMVKLYQIRSEQTWTSCWDLWLSAWD